MVVNPCENCYSGRSTYTVLGWTVETQILYPEIRTVYGRHLLLAAERRCCAERVFPGWVFCNTFEGYVVSSVTEVTTGYHYGIAFSADEVTVTIEDSFGHKLHRLLLHRELSFRRDASGQVEQILQPAQPAKKLTSEFVATRLNDSMDIPTPSALPSKDTTVDIDEPNEPVRTQKDPRPSASPISRGNLRPQARGRGFIECALHVKGRRRYNVTLSTVSGSAKEVRQRFLPAQQQPSAPVLNSAQFSSNPSKMLVTFDAPTDKAADSITLARG